MRQAPLLRHPYILSHFHLMRHPQLLSQPHLLRKPHLHYWEASSSWEGTSTFGKASDCEAVSDFDAPSAFEAASADDTILCCLAASTHTSKSHLGSWFIFASLNSHLRGSSLWANWFRRHACGACDYFHVCHLSWILLKHIKFFFKVGCLPMYMLNQSCKS